MSIRILGTGSYVPAKILTNEDLSDMVDTSDDWISKRVGVKERHVSECETAADFATEAAKRAIDSAGITPEEIDLIIAATISSETICPTVAGSVQTAIGATCPAFDISSACSGFLFALDTAVSFIARGGVRNVLVIGAERMSKLIDWEDRNTCVIFGDGAGAAVVSPGENYLASKLFTSGGPEVIEIPSFGGSAPFFKPKEEKTPYVIMHGQETFKFAVSKMTEDVKAVVEQAGLTLDDVDFVVPHQANIRIIEFASKRLGIPMEKFVVNIHKYGNTSAASVPMALDELVRSGKLKAGDIIVMTAFGGGLSSAACVIKF